MPLQLIDLGASRSISSADLLHGEPFARFDAALVFGGSAQARAVALSELDLSAKHVVAVELGTECLGFHIGESSGAPTNVVGFARFRLGALDASTLVELVRKRCTSVEALDAARTIFESKGWDVSICADVPGRIIDRLLRPYLNAALRSVDEGLATPPDMDQALRLGLGFPKGPIELLEASGLEAHYCVTSELRAALGTDDFVPARRARVQAMRESAGLGRGIRDGD